MCVYVHVYVCMCMTMYVHECLCLACSVCERGCVLCRCACVFVCVCVCVCVRKVYAHLLCVVWCGVCVCVCVCARCTFLFFNNTVVYQYINLHRYNNTYMMYSTVQYRYSVLYYSTTATVQYECINVVLYYSKLSRYCDMNTCCICTSTVALLYCKVNLDFINYMN